MIPKWTAIICLIPGFLLNQRQKAVWMDGHRLTTIVEGKQVVFDFDGTNMQTA